MAHAQQVRQLARAERMLQVTHAVDAMLTQWWTAPAPTPGRETGGTISTPIPTPASGDLPGSEDYQWQTKSLVDDSLETLGAQIIRLTVTDKLSGEVVMQLDLAAPLPASSDASALREDAP
ncbi:hypothetical protein HED60_04415 [Planctomycetales bacterium ZRK34]|nr:hypothetical protein HED60_04415 [Planctomycetales bacterium ZRK34]